MERSNKHRSRREQKARKAPKVPIKTYHWEDIRRARRRGGYPWTHLYKGPFEDKVDPEQFTMDAFRRSKSASPMGRRSDRIDISEVSSWADYSGKTTPTLLHELINEPQDFATKKNSRPSSVVIEEYVEDDLEDDVQVKEFHTESTGSSDNVSQYLDREERGAKTKSNSKESIEKDEGTKSEESSPRKRKLSAESSHSRYSLSKLGVIKTLQEAKKKIKVPKISFPTKKTAKKRSSPPKEPKPKKESKKLTETSRLKKVDKPVYIHIPLKPPPGESDEFSHLELQARKDNGESPAEQPEPQDKMKIDDNDGESTKKTEIATNEQNIELQKCVETKTPIKSEPLSSETLSVNGERKSPFSSLERGPRVTKKPPLKINPAFKQFLKDVRELKDKDLPLTNDDVVETQQLPSSDSEQSPQEDQFDKLFEASASRTSEDSRNVRSKSAEPQTKRRSSLESSYSRKSLSKLGIMKKLKDASEKIKNAFSMDSLRKKKTEGGKVEETKKTKLTSVVKTDRMDKPKHVEPVYIRIPLKPPEGQTDEFSYLADEPTGTTAAPETKKEERTDSLDSTSPVSEKNGDIQFIFLTPPSDDEILDEKEPDIPETPSSSDDVVFFSSLKQLAQDVVDQVSPETKRSTLETVREESVSDRGSTTEMAVEEEPAKEPQSEMVVDVEDGLNEPKTEEQLKSALKSPEVVPSPKRVSFKRKSRNGQKQTENEYEPIEAPKEDVTMKDGEKVDSAPQHQDKALSQSMSVDEEKTYLDQKIVKDTSLEEDYNKWSNLPGDHEYEPITPPEELTIATSTNLPSVTVLDGEDTDPKVVISATEILDKPVEEKKRAFFQFGRIHKDKEVKEREKSQERAGSSDTQSRSSQSRDIPHVDEPPSKTSDGPNKFQVALKHGTEQLKTKTNELRTKINNIKRPNIHLPKAPEFKKPDFKKFKIEKPKLNIHLPKIPDTATIRLPHISLPGARKISETRTIETRQYSTESNVDDSDQQTKRHKFDLTFGGTFPRFRKPKKPPQTDVSFATVSRPKKTKDVKSSTVSSEGSSVRIPLHSEDSTDDSDRLQFVAGTTRSGFEDRDISKQRRSSDDVAAEDEYERENQAINRADYLSRWQHGNFRERKDDEDNEDEQIIGRLVEQRFGRAGESYGDYEVETLEDRLRRDEERPRYIEEEEELEFDLRLTQNRHMVTDLDNLEDEQTGQTRDGYSSEGSVSLHRQGRLGKLDIDSDEFFVVHEIREGFQTPANALAQMNEYDPIGSNRSLPSQIREEVPLKAERKTIKKPKRKKTPHVSREEIPGDRESIEDITTPSRPKRRSTRNKRRDGKDEAIVPYQETIPLEVGTPHGQRLDFPRESLGILGDDERDDQDNEVGAIKGKDQSDPYKRVQAMREQEEPSAPPRKHRSLKSLTQSENESIMTDSPQIETSPPKRPNRRSRSHTSSLSRVSLPPSQREDTHSLFTDEGYLAEAHQIPSYLIENQHYKQQQSYLDQQPCVEEPCVQDIRDYMGYAVVDKSKPPREPPLPPPKTAPRRRKRAIDQEQDKFATVPRNMGLNQQAPPVRPLRNYSTLSHVKEIKRDLENKENEVDIAQYIEIEDEIGRDLVSGEVVQKMRQRPLPAPPRPPRKSKITRKSLQDITSQGNIIPTTSNQKPSESTIFQEETVSTQTEPLPPDFICEEIKQEPTDTIITPRATSTDPVFIQKFELYDPRESQRPEIKRELITPTVYSFEETVTHGTLLVQPIDGAKVVPDHQLSRERLVPVTKEFSDEDETSEVPESFKQLQNPKSKGHESEGLRAERLQVSDLDVDRLTVNELLASKITVSEIDSSTISTNEIQGKSGSLKLGDVELPPQLLDQLVRQLDASRETDPQQKKTPTVERQSPLEGTSSLRQEQVLRESSFTPEPPQPPPRSCSTLEEASPRPIRGELLEPDVDDQPPPRPPQPLEGLYLPSQPPASFYALRARQIVDGDENIPTAAPRRKRHGARSRPVSRSRSTSDDSSTAAPHRPPSRLLPRRASEPSIPELASRLGQACVARLSNCFKRLMCHLTEDLIRNADGQQDLHVMMAILLVLIAGLMLLSGDGERTVIHLHHWEYFNPPKDL